MQDLSCYSEEHFIKMNNILFIYIYSFLFFIFSLRGSTVIFLYERKKEILTVLKCLPSLYHIFQCNIFLLVCPLGPHTSTHQPTLKFSFKHIILRLVGFHALIISDFFLGQRTMSKKLMCIIKLVILFCLCSCVNLILVCLFR